ncbi:MAG: serine/threonine-protein kinase [Myxococcota bacterium]
MAQRLGRYEILRPLGRGGMAEVFLARLTGVEGFSRPVVIKRIRPELMSRPDVVQMFLDEARLGARLTHSSIVQVLDFGDVEGAHFMAMEFVDGGNVGHLLTEACLVGDPPPPVLCAYLAARTLEGLAFAHDYVEPLTRKPLNVVHRDVSPQNILVSRYGEVKLADFGVAKNAEQLARTGTGVIKGKLAYMAPEQILAEGVDRRTDIFALGIVLHELLTRKRLYKEDSDAQTMKRIIMDPVPPPSEDNPEIDAELDAIVLRALERERERRYAHAREMAVALQRWYLARVRDDPRHLLADWVACQLAGRPAGGEDTTGARTSATRVGGPIPGAQTRLSAAAEELALQTAGEPSDVTRVDAQELATALAAAHSLSPDEKLLLLGSPTGCPVFRWGEGQALYLVELSGRVDCNLLQVCLEAVWNDPEWSQRYAVIFLTQKASSYDRELREFYKRPSVRPPAEIALVTRRGMEGALASAVASGVRALTGTPLRTYASLAQARAGALKALAAAGR